MSNEVDRRCVLAASGLARAGYALAQHRCWRRRSLSCISVWQGEHEGESKGIRKEMWWEGGNGGSGGLRCVVVKANVVDWRWLE